MLTRRTSNVCSLVDVWGKIQIEKALPEGAPHSLISHDESAKSTLRLNHMSPLDSPAPHNPHPPYGY